MAFIRTLFTKYTPVLLAVFVFILTILYATLSILRHIHFQSGAFDLGLYDQAVWNFGHGFTVYNTVKERIIFGDHLVLTLPLLAPLLYLWDDARVLLIVQAVAVAVSAIPIFWVAQKRLGSYVAAWAVTMLYSLFYGIQYGIFFDFHPILLGTALLAWLIWTIEYDKKKLFWICFAFCLLTQENMGIALFCLGLCYIFRRDFWKTAILLMGSGIVWSFVAMKFSASLSPVGYQYMPETPTNPWQLVTRLFDSEEKRQVWLYSYSWFSFLPLFSPGSLLAVLGDLSQYFVTGNEFARMWSPFMHHRAILSIFLTMGLLDVLVFFRKKNLPIPLIAGILLLIAGYCQFHFHFALNKLAKAEYWKEESWMDDTRALIKLVPKEGSVAAQQSLVPHLSHRKEIYLIYPREHNIMGAPCGQELCWWLDFGGNPDYLVVDTRPNQWLTQTLETDEHWHSALSNMEKTGVIRVEQTVGGARIYRVDNELRDRIVY